MSINASTMSLRFCHFFLMFIRRHHNNQMRPLPASHRVGFDEPDESYFDASLPPGWTWDDTAKVTADTPGEVGVVAQSDDKPVSVVGIAPDSLLAKARACVLAWDLHMEVKL